MLARSICANALRSLDRSAWRNCVGFHDSLSNRFVPFFSEPDRGWFFTDELGACPDRLSFGLCVTLDARPAGPVSCTRAGIPLRSPPARRLGLAFTSSMCWSRLYCAFAHLADSTLKLSCSFGNAFLLYNLNGRPSGSLTRLLKCSVTSRKSTMLCRPHKSE